MFYKIDYDEYFREEFVCILPSGKSDFSGCYSDQLVLQHRNWPSLSCLPFSSSFVSGPFLYCLICNSPFPCNVRHQTAAIKQPNSDCLVSL